MGRTHLSGKPELLKKLLLTASRHYTVTAFRKKLTVAQIKLIGIDGQGFLVSTQQTVVAGGG